ncbi:hypothetical protein [Hyphomonas sp.]|uniref:hypothetical protein n=1 Tax=Hyphomonas sp. TaxID=87 RepID=UPI000DFF9EEF|nr:hypothetical protein [Hyphomonas sp.]RCL90149.1 MAG: hypothetical protein DBW63_00185 [Hyphomonas sp.]
MAAAKKSKQLNHIAAMIFCQGADVDELSPEEEAALHAMKHELLASLERLYTRISRDVAEPLVVDILKTIVPGANDLEPNEAAALDAMRYEMLASLSRLYMQVDRSVAEPIVAASLRKLLHELGRG